LLVARGQAGWPPLFNARKRKFIDLVPKYFKVEHEARSTTAIPGASGRSSPKLMIPADQLRPKLAEFPFDEQGEGFVPITVSSPNVPEQTLRFKGIMDRVDLSESGDHLGVVDFKTGAKSNFEAESAVQDLLYESVIRRSKDFSEVKKISSKYIFLAKRDEGIGLLELRANRDRNVFLPEVDGGLIGQEYQDALISNKTNAEEELRALLSKLVEASFSGNFPTHDVKGSAKSFEYCSTCGRLGKKRIRQLSKIAYPSSSQEPEFDPGEEIS
jgi:hypothetical protein